MDNINFTKNDFYPKGILIDKLNELVMGVGEIDAYTKTESDDKYETIENVADLLANKADKATTIEGYGITDAYTKTEVDDVINLKYFEIANTVLSQELLPNVAYKFTTRTNDLVLTLSPITDATVLNVYYFIIDTGDTLPSITWPNDLVWYEDTEPTITINKHYEFSIIDNVVKYYEV